MSFVHVHTTKEGKPTGEFRGFEDESIAILWIHAYRNSRDNDPVWIEFRRGDYDWHIIEFNEDGTYKIIY